MLSKRMVPIGVLLVVLSACSVLPFGRGPAPPMLPPPSERSVMQGSIVQNRSVTELRLIDAAGTSSCTGTFVPVAQGTSSIPVTCADGKKGVATVSRESANATPSGTVLMGDGAMVSINFGVAAPAAGTTANAKPADKPPAKTAAKPSPLLKIKQGMVKDSIASFKGECPCPDSKTAGGQRCGTNSEYSKNGRKAVYCYTTDITDDMASQNAERF